MSSEEETPSFRARASARRSSGSSRTVVNRFGAIQAIYTGRLPFSNPGRHRAVEAGAHLARRAGSRHRAEMDVTFACVAGARDRIYAHRSDGSEGSLPRFWSARD